jgi:hypothetical protein
MKMPRGGKRAGAGRKKGSANVKSRQIVDEAAADGRKLPLAHMLDILNDPKASQARKDWAAGCAAAYCHPRLSASATTSLNTPPGSGNTVSLNVWAIPHGAQIGDNNQIVWPNGDTEPAEPFENYAQPTPPLTPLPALTHHRAEPEPFEVEELEPSENVTRLDVFKNRRDDDGSAGAA